MAENTQTSNPKVSHSLLWDVTPVFSSHWSQSAKPRTGGHLLMRCMRALHPTHVHQGTDLEMLAAISSSYSPR